MSHRVAPGLSAETLERIIPVAQQCGVDDVTVTISTLERHRDGFLINVRADWVGPTGGMPGLVWLVTDGHETTFTPANCGGGGGGGRPGDYPADALPQSWRMHCYFAPAIAPDATTLTLELRAFRLSEPTFSDEGKREFSGWKRLRELTNLGQVTVALR